MSCASNHQAQGGLNQVGALRRSGPPQNPSLSSVLFHLPVTNANEDVGMHVATYTSLCPEQLNQAFRSLGSGDRSEVRFQAERSPPKFYLNHLPVTMAPAAELDIQRQSGGSTVVLRLMWGPLPAPFPRAMVGAGLIGGILLATLGPAGWLTLALAGLLAVVPTAALMYQKRGEARLQSVLATLIGSKGFLDQAH